MKGLLYLVDVGNSDSARGSSQKQFTVAARVSSLFVEGARPSQLLTVRRSLGKTSDAQLHARQLFQWATIEGIRIPLVGRVTGFSTHS